MTAATAMSSAIARGAARGTPRKMDKRTTRSATVRRHRSAVRLEATSEAATAETNAPPAAAGESFDWFSAWYPLRPVSFLDANEPNELRVLGKKLVAYLDPTCKEWRVLEDSCPHRRAPLSLGYVQKDGTLACRYHGWAFDGEDGSCVSIPMSVDEAAEKTACASPRSCATSYPSRVEDGILWVWPTAGADGLLASAGAPCATSLAREGTLPGEWGMVELPVGYAPALENQFDPSHAEWLHARYDAEGQLDERANAVPSSHCSESLALADVVPFFSTFLTYVFFVAPVVGLASPMKGTRCPKPAAFMTPAKHKNATPASVK